MLGRKEREKGCGPDGEMVGLEEGKRLLSHRGRKEKPKERDLVRGDRVLLK
jgi:hypothetical protein